MQRKVSSVNLGTSVYNLNRDICFSKVIWDNGAEIGVDGNRVLYFNSLKRVIDDGRLKLNIQNWDWYQTFGFDTAQGDNGEILKVTGTKTVLIEMKDNSQGQFMKLELITNKGPVELWIRHPQPGIVVFSVKDNVYSAALPAGITEIYKVQFVGQMDELAVDIGSITFQ